MHCNPQPPCSSTHHNHTMAILRDRRRHKNLDQSTINSDGLLNKQTNKSFQCNFSSPAAAGCRRLMIIIAVLMMVFFTIFQQQNNKDVTVDRIKKPQVRDGEVHSSFSIDPALLMDFGRTIKWDANNRANVTHLECEAVDSFMIDPALKMDGGFVWSHILHTGRLLMDEEKTRNDGSVAHPFSFTPLVAVEVGANTLTDAMEMASCGFETHSFEPSPRAFRKMKDRWTLKGGDTTRRREIMKNIFLYNYAVGDADGGDILFDNSGSTGAAVLSQESAAKKEDVTRVKTITMDSFFSRKLQPDVALQLPSSALLDGKIFAAKIDVQGFEAKVFDGMKDSIFERKIHFILTEFDPMALDEVNGFAMKCTESLSYIRMMHEAGYRIYALKLVTHPKNKRGWEDLENIIVHQNRPFSDVEGDCLNMYRLQNEVYKSESWAHVWTDFLAVSPDAPWPKKVSSIISIIKENENEKKKDVSNSA